MILGLQEILFTISFLILITIFFVLLYNLLCLTKFLEPKQFILIFITALLTYGVLFVISLLFNLNLLFITLFNYSRVIYYLIWAFGIIETIIYLSMNKKIHVKAHNSRKEYAGVE